MKIVDLLIVVSLVATLGCGTLGTVANNLTKPVDPAQPQGPTVVQKTVDDALQGTPWKDLGLGALAAAVLGVFAKTRKVEKEVDEQWDRQLEGKPTGKG